MSFAVLFQFLLLVNDLFTKVKAGQANCKPKKNLEEELRKKAEDQRNVGRLSAIAAQVLMEVFYAAREARLDLYRAIAGLARHLLRWTPECDRRLHRLMSYIHCSMDHVMCGWVGDDAVALNIHCYADANFGTDGGKSTSGVQVQFEGPRTCFPVAVVSVAQQSVSHSTPEAEIVAFAMALRKLGLPILEFWSVLKRQS